MYTGTTHLQNVEVAANDTVEIQSDLQIAGNMAVSTNGALNISFYDVDVTGNLSTVDNGTLIMQTSGTLTVHENASFGGGDETDQLTSGTLLLHGNFVQSGNATAFAAGSGFTVSMEGTAAQSIGFSNPDSTAGSSHFGNLQIANTSLGGVTLNTNVFVEGQFSTADILTDRYVFGAGNTLNARGWSAGGTAGVAILHLNNMPVVIRPGLTINPASDVSFEGSYDPEVNEFAVERLAGETFTFTNFTFPSITLGTNGHHVAVYQVGGTGPGLLVTMINPVPACSGGFMPGSLAANGATLACP